MKQTKQIQAFVKEGASDFAAAVTTNQCPYEQNSQGWDWWLHGWWGAYYEQRNERIKAGKACEYCAEPMDNVTTGIYVIGKHGASKTVCGACKDDLVQFSDYQVMAIAKGIS